MDVSYLLKLRMLRPRVHCITNYVSAVACANALLAVGASPVMADAIEEVADIVSRSQSLVLNLGTPNPARVQAMLLAGKTANEHGLPVMLDPVGAGASAFRGEVCGRLLDEVRFAAIRGNISELRALWEGMSAGGIDADEKDDSAYPTQSERRRLVKELAKQTGAVIILTGEYDLISDGTQGLSLSHGHPMLSHITGTGCMLSCLIGAFLGANPESPLLACAGAVGGFGVCGERAARGQAVGTGSFSVALLDALSFLGEQEMEEVRYEYF